MKRCLAAAISALLLMIVGCGKPYTASGEYCFSDSTGVTVCCAAHPKRVAILYSSYAETWTLAGGNAEITVGEAVERGFVPQDAILVDDGAGHSVIHTELLVAQSPDLVIGTVDYPCQVEAVELCRSLGIPAALFSQDSASEYLDMLRIFCDLTGSDQAWEEYGESVQADMQDIEKTLPLNTDASVLLLRVGSSQKSTKAKGSEDSMVGGMLSRLGVRNITDEAPVLLDGLSIEVIVQEDPDWILISLMGDEDAARAYSGELFSSPGWNGLSAVQNGRVYILERDLFHFKPNARWPEAWMTLIDLFDAE